MVRGGVVVVGACWLALTACGGGNAEPKWGSVVGTVRGYGGPAVIVHGKVQPADNGRPMTDSTITARRTDGYIVKASTGPLGHYAMSVPPGRWTVQTNCSTPVTVTVASTQQVRVPLRCDFP